LCLGDALFTCAVNRPNECQDLLYITKFPDKPSGSSLDI
jgi:hypothetical protein